MDYPMDLMNRQQFFFYVHSNTKVKVLNHVIQKQYNNHHQYTFQTEIIMLSVLHDQKQLSHVSQKAVGKSQLMFVVVT